MTTQIRHMQPSYTLHVVDVCKSSFNDTRKNKAALVQRISEAQYQIYGVSGSESESEVDASYAYKHA